MLRRRILAMATTTGLLCPIACSSESSVVPQPAPIDTHAFDLPRTFDAGSTGPTEKERALATTYTGGLASPGFSQVTALLATDVHFAFPGLDDGRGREAAARWHEALFGAFDGRVVAPSRIFRTAGTQTIEWTFSGKQARDWMGVAATGKPVTFQGATILWTRDDGSIVDIHTYFDVAVVKAQLGAGPPELASLPVPAAPTGAPQVVEQQNTPVEASNVAAVHASLDAFEKPDSVPYLDTLTDDIEILNPARATPARGKADAKTTFTAMHKAIGSLDSIVDNAWGIERDVVVEYSLNGPQSGPLGWVPARADRPIDLKVLDVVELHDGKLAKIWRYTNPAQILTAGGAPPALQPADAGADASRRTPHR